MSLELVDSNIVLRVENVSKKFSRNLKTSLFYGVKDIYGEITATRKAYNALRDGEFWAVNDVSFELKKGDALGLVGANGSGKTTLLRMISGLVKADAGHISITGRVVPLIALGAGFNQILTGRENVYVNLAILGMSRNEIEQVFDSVIDFAEIGDAIDAPVQTYSSGMSARLGFACAVHAKADILLIDEVLSVGDMRFRSKCYRRLAELRMAGTSFILVSHNTNAILSMCDTAIYLGKGKQLLNGEPYVVMNKFEEDLSSMQPPPKTEKKNALSADATQFTEVNIKEVLLKNNADTVDSLQSGELAKIILKVHCKVPQQGVVLAALIREMSGESETILHLSSDKENYHYALALGDNELSIEMPVCGLAPGLYTAKIYLHKEPFYMLDAFESFIFRVVAKRSMKQCIYYQKIEWGMSS